MGSLADKVVLVTGASSGIGWGSVLRFAGEGATVIAAARRAERGKELVAQVEAAGGKAEFVTTDIADEKSLDALFAHIEKRYGRLDCAFNNAALEAGPALLPDAPVETFDRIFGTNVRGTWLCMRHESRIMRAQRSGVILNTSSAAVVKTYPESSVYIASKHAIVGMTKAASLDLAEFGVRVNVILPGSVRTEMIAGWIEKRLDGDEAPLLATIPMRRIGTPDEIAATAAFLLSDQSSYITGAVLVIDGGLTVP